MLAIDAACYKQVSFPITKSLLRKCRQFSNNLDVGCGEERRWWMFYSVAITAIQRLVSTLKPGINLATQQGPAFLRGRPIQMPFSDGAFTTVLDLFSPSAYKEFTGDCAGWSFIKGFECGLSD